MPEPPGAATSSGAEFLQARRLRRDGRLRAATARREGISILSERLRALAQEVRRREPRDREILADWSVLLPRAETSAFKSELETLAKCVADDGLALRLTGPLPAFGFVDPVDAGHV
jgi:hypothetical protein